MHAIDIIESNSICPELLPEYREVYNYEIELDQNNYPVIVKRLGETLINRTSYLDKFELGVLDAPREVLVECEVLVSIADESVF